MNYIEKYFNSLHKRKFGSSCCGYPVRVDKSNLFNYIMHYIDDEGCICDKCDKPCDLIRIKKKG